MAEHDATTQTGQLLGEIDEALGRNPVLTGKQFDDVRKLRAEIEVHCSAGDLERARGCRELALKLIRSGAPAPE